MRYVVLLVWIAANIALTSGSFAFSGNFSSKDIDNYQWKFRETEFAEVDVTGLYVGGNVFAAAIAGTKNGTEVNATVGVVVGATYCALTNFPVTYLVSYQESIDLNWGSVGQGAATLDVSGSAAYIAVALLRLEETDPTGQLVNTLSLKWTLPITQSGVSYYLAEASKATDDIKYITFTGVDNDPNFPDFSINITHLASSRAGIVNKEFGLVPGSIESAYTITNYPYASTSNNLSLVLLVATGSGSIAASGRTVESGDKTVYFSLSNQALISGNKHSIDISLSKNGSLDDLANSNIETQLSAKYSGSVTVHAVRITFPAGASDISYDPAIGAGASVQETGVVGSSASATLPCTLFVLLVALLVVMA
jgi:hypothetical protein